MFKIILYTVCVYNILYIYVQADSIEELQMRYVQHIMDCSKQFSITQEQLEMLRNKQMPDSKSVKCMFACAYQKAGIMDGSNLSVEKVYALSDKYLSDDVKKLQNAKRFADACQSVNFVDLGGQDQIECERAALIFQCSLEKASQFNFIV